MTRLRWKATFLKSDNRSKTGRAAQRITDATLASKALRLVQ
jgi:hypothetical protein